jgi:hypothetical protein
MRRASGNLSDVAGAGLLLAIGALGAFLTHDLPMRSGPRIGPGAMPFAVSLLVAAMGLLLALRAALVAGAPPALGRLRPVLAISAAILAFAFTLERTGLVAASLLLVALAVAARPRPRWPEAAVYAAALIGGTVLVFKFLLKLPLPLWPA